jgi:hypothetical protein
VISLKRYGFLLFLLVAVGIAALSPRLQGKGAPIDILFQTTTDVEAELAPCG